MDPRVTNMRTFSISVPGIEQPVPLESQFSERLPGLLSNLSVAREDEVLSYSEGELGALLGETEPVVHPNLWKTNYISHMKEIFTDRNKGPSTLWSSVAVTSMLGAVGAAMIYKNVTDLSWALRGLSVLAVVAFTISAVGSCFTAMESRNDGEDKKFYSYLDAYGGEKLHIKWKEYWRSMMIDRCDRKKLKEVADRAKQFGFRMRHLRRPGFATKDDGTPLNGEDIRNFMLHNDDTGFAAITRLLWSVEAARRAVGKPLREKIGSSPANAKFFLKLAEALSGSKPEDLSLPAPYSQPLADLVDGAAFYAGLGNDVPTHAAALASFLARYYYERDQRNNASLMMHSMHYLLQGKWRSAFALHLVAAQRSVEGNSQLEEVAVRAIHYLGIARLMRERIIAKYNGEIRLGTYPYASAAALAFDELASSIVMEGDRWETLRMSAENIMHVMVNNAPFREFR